MNMLPIIKPVAVGMCFLGGLLMYQCGRADAVHNMFSMQKDEEVTFIREDGSRFKLKVVEDDADEDRSSMQG